MLNLKTFFSAIAFLMLCTSTNGQDTTIKLPPLEMLMGDEKVKYVIELAYPADYEVYSLEGQFIDSGHTEFLDYTHYEPGIYFLRYDTIKVKFEREQNPVEIQEIQNENQRLYSALFVTLILAGLILPLLLIKIKKIKTEQKKLLVDIEDLKKQHNHDNSIDLSNTQSINLKKEHLENSIQSKLNESDWNIIQQLIKHPSISNRDLSEAVSLSVEGCRSSLKKMYRLFEIPSSRNMKLTLVIKLIQRSKKSN